MNLRHILGITLATAAFAIPALGEEPSLHAIAVRPSWDWASRPAQISPAGERVNIMQWRAAFQHDIDTNAVDGPKPTDLYPDMHVDVYPDEVLRVTDARAYMGAVGLDNPISRPKNSPVLEQMAEGFGSLTVLPQQRADGKGVWADGRWRVVITRPLADGDAYSPSLKPGDETLAAFAVWDGGSSEVGSRKAWANWVQLKLDAVNP